MTALSIQVKLLEDAWDSPDTAGRPDVNVIKRNFERMRRLVEDLLDAARIQADRFTVRRDDVDAARILDDAVATWRPQAEAAGLTVETSWEGPLPVSADAQRIEQVVGNMLSNAIKFSPGGGTIRLEAQRTGDEVVVAVTDQGIGLKDEQIQRLFQPFSRVHDEADTPVAGTGMGLFISIGIAQAHEGRIDVESPGPGRGTTFRLRLPVAPPADAE
jgi:signal transduction histidine kinase